MDINELKDFITARNKGVEPSLTFDQNCMKQLEINFSDGEAGLSHHIEYDHIMVDEQNGQKPYKVAIARHRESISREELQLRFGI